MAFSWDRTGFPLLEVVGVPGVAAAHLLPVMKVQFERFLAEPNALGDAWYEAVLAGNPRVSYRKWTEDNREQLLLTGVLAEEAVEFAKWLGEGFDLPKVEEWRSIYRWLERRPFSDSELAMLRSHREGNVAGPIVDGLAHQLRAESWCDLSMMKGGVVEWVRKGRTYVGLGSPRCEFKPNLWNPLIPEGELVPIPQGRRIRFFGFRLIRRAQ